MGWEKSWHYRQKTHCVFGWGMPWSTGLTSGVGSGGTHQKHNSCWRLTEIPLSQHLDSCHGQKYWRNLHSCWDMSSDLSLSLCYTLWNFSLCYHLLLFKNQNFFSSPWFLKIPLTPSSANFSFFFPPLYPAFILSFSFLLPLKKKKQGKTAVSIDSDPEWKLKRRLWQVPHLPENVTAKSRECVWEEWEEQRAKRMNKGIQWVERQMAWLVRFSGYPETHGRMSTKRKDSKSTQK